MSHLNDAKVWRTQRLKDFVAHNIDSMAAAARSCYGEAGKGVIVIEVDKLVGGSQLRPNQPELQLGYIEIGRAMTAVTESRDDLHTCRDCRFPDEALVLALYRDSTYDLIRFNIEESLKANLDEYVDQPFTLKPTLASRDCGCRVRP